jgi:ribosomal protein S18 acetylase RimI-like enzyme
MCHDPCVDVREARLTGTTIRPMLPADVAAAADALRRGDWGDREAFFRFATGHPNCRPILAERDREIVGTGVATVSGRVGWVGTIWVAPAVRRRGLGRALTEAVIEELEGSGCRTLVLVATEAGRRLYERLGFEVLTHDHAFVASGRGAERTLSVADPSVRHFVPPADLDAAAALDAWATGEDRRHILATCDGWVAGGAPGEVTAFTLRSPFGGVATVARDASDALRLFDLRRREAGPEGRVRAGVLDENTAGLERLVAEGWTEVWSGPRMIRGEPLDWTPTGIWSQFNHGLG